MKAEPQCYLRHIRVQQIKADALAKEAATAVRSYLQCIHKFVQIFSYVPVGAIEGLEGFARISKKLSDEIDVELEQMRNKYIKRVFDRSYTYRENLLRCIQCISDGIETNCRSWKEWQSNARQVLELYMPKGTDKLKSYEKVTGNVREAVK